MYIPGIQNAGGDEMCDKASFRSGKKERTSFECPQCTRKIFRYPCECCGYTKERQEKISEEGLRFQEEYFR